MQLPAAASVLLTQGASTPSEPCWPFVVILCTVVGCRGICGGCVSAVVLCWLCVCCSVVVVVCLLFCCVGCVSAVVLWWLCACCSVVVVVCLL